MAVLLNRAYAGYLSGTVVELTAELEASLIAQGLATASTEASITVGAVTCNAIAGTCAIAAGASSLVVTNNLVDATSVVFAVVSQAAADGTLLRVERVVCAAGAFTIYGTANATATTLISWGILNRGGTPLRN